jgi:serine/threonine protein kinase
MSNQYRPRKGQKLASWELLKLLGKGGNAEVWKAKNEDGRLVALKILKTEKSKGEPYKRFKAEVKFLRSFGDQSGVLPILDAYLPQQLSRQNPAWLAMPVAISIKDALGESPDLTTVVEAIATIAETLASLAAKKVSHQDIKPSNLYSLNGQWAIGDFGLVDYPDKEAITASGRKLGPLYFMAPEMIINPKDAEGYPADVYSLAKTFYVLATGQMYPPQGEQRVDNLQLTLSYYILYPRIEFLNKLIESATQHNPEDRPTMAEFASELRAWLAPVKEPAFTEKISDLVARIVRAADSGARSDRKRQQNIDEALQYLEKFRVPLTQIASELAKTGRSDGTLSEGVQVFHYGPSQYNFEISERTGKGCGYDFRIMTLPPGVDASPVQYSCYAPVGSVKLEQYANNVINTMFNCLRPALERFANILESQAR